MVGSVVAVAALFTSCASTSPDPASSDPSGDVGISLIVKTNSNPYYIAMQDAAEAAAKEAGVELTLAAGKAEGDEDTQIQAIENAISRGDKGILIAPNGPGVNDAITKARDAGLYVIALDTAPDPTNVVDVTFATDNFAAGKTLGEWAAAELDGEPAVIALLDLYADKVISVDYNRDQGFLTGMGIDVADPTIIGDEASSGTYTAGQGGTFTIAGHQASDGAVDTGRTAMETLLSKNSDINVVYAVNAPAAAGAYEALKAAGIEDRTLVVAVDGGCDNVAYVKQGTLSALVTQYPDKMAALGVEAIVDYVGSGATATTSPGLDFFDTGSALITDQPVEGLESISSDEASTSCYGTD